MLQRRLLVFVLAALFVPLLAPPADAFPWPWGKKVTANDRKSEIGGTVNPADTTAHPVPGDGNAVFTSEQSKDRDAWVYISKVYSDTVSSGPRLQSRFADSCGTFYAAPYKSKALFIWPSVWSISNGGNATDTAAVIRIAVQIRRHFISGQDSSLTFPILPWRVSNRFLGEFAASDSIGHTAVPTKGQNNLGLFENEFLLVLRTDRTFNATDVQLATTRGISVELPPGMLCPYLSVRFRVLNSVAAVTDALKARIDMTFVGTPN